MTESILQQGTRVLSDAVNTLAQGTVAYQEAEATATGLAANSPCLVPGTDNEYYDCCGDESIETTCYVFGSINAVMLAGVVFSLIGLIWKNQWFRGQWLLWFTMLFQILVCTWRTLFYLYGGFVGASSWSFITYRSSDPGDFIVSLTGFAMYLYQLRQKYSSANEPEFDYHSLKKRLAIWFWINFLIYSCYWGFFYWLTLRMENLTYVDVAVSVAFVVMIFVYLYLGVGLIKAMNKSAGIDADDPNEDSNAPGVRFVVWILVLQCIAMFLRAVFVSIQDINKVSHIESINKGNPYWELVMSIQCTTQLYASGVMFLSIYLIFKAEKEFAEASERMPISPSANKID